MTEQLLPPDPETVAKLREMSERRLSAEEFEAYVRAPMSEAEREEILAQIEWFMRRYPTARERLAYARRKCRQLVESPLRAGLDSER